MTSNGRNSLATASLMGLLGLLSWPIALVSGIILANMVKYPYAIPIGLFAILLTLIPLYWLKNLTTRCLLTDPDIMDAYQRWRSTPMSSSEYRDVALSYGRLRASAISSSELVPHWISRLVIVFALCNKVGQVVLITAIVLWAIASGAFLIGGVIVVLLAIVFLVIR